jgi:hypothetical protein
LLVICVAVLIINGSKPRLLVIMGLF